MWALHMWEGGGSKFSVCGSVTKSIRAGCTEQCAWIVVMNIYMCNTDDWEPYSQVGVDSLGGPNYHNKVPVCRDPELWLHILQTASSGSCNTDKGFREGGFEFSVYHHSSVKKKKKQGKTIQGVSNRKHSKSQLGLFHSGKTKHGSQNPFHI